MLETPFVFDFKFANGVRWYVMKMGGALSLVLGHQSLLDEKLKIKKQLPNSWKRSNKKLVLTL